MNRSLVVCAFLLLAAGAVLPAAADVHPNDASGFKVDQAFQSGDLDHINLFNGNLTLSIPLGQVYHVGGTLSYRFTLTYNSNPWSFWQRFDQSYNTDFNEADPSYCSNAGLGWRVSFGRLFTPCVPANQDSQGLAVYEGPDGSQHIFYATLHPGEAATPNVNYTRDGSYLRLSKEQQLGTWLMEYPDGTLNRFDASGRLMQIIDRFNNQVSFDYSTPNEWIISDTQGRTHTVYFRTDLLPYTQTVDRVVLAAFNGSAATYQFNYYPAVTLYKGCPFNDPPAAGYTTNQTSAPLLASVSQPDGSAYAIPRTGYVTTAPGSGQLCVSGSGSLLSLTLPTLGQLQWTYQQYSFPVSNSKPWRTWSSGVATRTMVSAAGATVGQWTYATAITQEPPGVKPLELVNSVTDPLSNRIERHFSVSVFNSYTDPGIYDYGAPFTVKATAPGSSTLYLSSRTFNASNVLVRSEYATFEHDVVDATGLLPDAANNNRRMLASRTVFEDDGQSYTETDASSFDGLGHYRWTRKTGSFPGSQDKVVGLYYNPGAGLYDVNQAANAPAADNTFVMLPPSSPWTLENAAWRQITEGAHTAFSEYCFSPANGFVYRTRILSADGVSESANDVLILHNPDAAGNLASEQYFGGDLPGQALPVGGNSCLIGGGGQPPLPPVQYQINNTYQYGSLATSQFAGTSFLSTDQDIDSNTGLVKTSRDSAGVATRYQYDGLGRLFYERPAQSAYTQYLYAPATGPGALATVTIQQQVNGTANVETQRKLSFDDFGRVIREDVLMPNGSTSSRSTSYNALGWKTSVGELGSSAQTSYQGFDPFGRPATIVLPDGHRVTIAYHGIRQVDRTARIGQAWSGSAVNEGYATTSEIYDRLGRLYQVVEPPGGLTATYSYDPGNRLTQVSLTGGVTQTRTYRYDMRGFLLSDTQPERSAAISYSGYDARGHATRRIDGANDLSYLYDAAERLTTVYRTGTSPSCTPGGTNCLKAFTYDGANSAGLSRGKLIQAQRYNFPVLNGNQHVELLQTNYTYGGLDGRLSQRDLRLLPDGDTTPTTHESFTQSWTYNDLGDVVSESYPACGPQMSGCSGSPARVVSYSYAAGRLTALPGYTGTVPGQPGGIGITYAANGLVAQVAHWNGVLMTQASDPNGMARPAAITVAGPGGTLWSTGSYQYDGTGNVKQIGGSYFLYDNVSRLVDAHNVPTDPLNGGVQFQTFTYDNFGNLQSFGGSVGLNTPTSSTSNQLTGGGYDSAGNLRSWNGAVYDYDSFNQLAHYKNGAQEWLYMYDADDERVWSFQVGVAPRFDRWTLRGLDSRVLRTYEVSAWGWSNWSSGNFWEDLIYRGNQPMAGYFSSGQQHHFDVDHLGTVRLITNVAGGSIAYHAYFPYGQEATAFNLDSERMKFAGQERDLASLASDQDDLDNLHARFLSPLTGRFLAVDPLSGDARVPQSWNRYAYARGNPLKYVDPFGLDAVCYTDDCITVTTTPPPPADEVLFLGRLQLDAFLNDLSTGFGFLDVRSARSYYLSRFDKAVGEGNDAQAFFYYSVNWLFVPDSQKDLAVQLGMAVLPVGKFMKLGGKTLELFSGYATEKTVLEAAEKWLGAGYKEIAEGVFRSADDARQFRMTTGDLTDINPHVHFESVAPNGRDFFENGHVYLLPDH